MPSNNIIGNGFIANNFLKINKLIKKSGYLIYSAGISNSQEISKKEFSREIKLFRKFTKKNNLRNLIFISTADINNNLKKKDKYIKNKIIIERLIKKNFSNYIIIRLPQIIGKSNNKKTLINYFFDCIKKNKKIKVYKDIKRNILDIDDVIKALKIIIFDKKINKKIITLCNKYYIKPIEIIKIIEKKLKKKAIIEFKQSNRQNWSIKNKLSVKLFKKAKVKFDKNYLSNKINKYF